MQQHDDTRGGTPASPGGLKGFLAGSALLGRGFRLWITSPRLMLLGAIPALIVGVVYAMLLLGLLVNIGALSTWLTPFAEGWHPVWSGLARVTAGIAVAGLALFVLVFSFAAVTLTVGEPFYERIWRQVENRLGGAPPERPEPFWHSLRRGLGQGSRLLLLALLTGAGVFLLGLVPIAGPVLAPVLGAVFGGWILALELTGFAFDARGLSLRERRRILGARRSSTLGFGVASYLVFLVPLLAVVAMPAAVAGATMLTRDALTDRG